jgi:hypothetical protein
MKAIIKHLRRLEDAVAPAQREPPMVQAIPAARRCRLGANCEPAQFRQKSAALAGRAGYACARVMRSPQFAPALLVTVVVWMFGILFFEARGKLFWYDELLTFHVSSLQPFSRFWRALKAGVDGMPLGYYLLVRAARMLPGDAHVTLRLPSILGYLITLLGVYWFARKRLPAFAGLAAVFLITLSPYRWYALEARSYSLLVGFLAISAVLWQRIGERRFMTPLFALFLTLAISCHHLAVVAISAFGVAELTWTLLSRRIRWGVWAACLLATSPFFMSLPVLLHYRDVFGKNFWSRPSWGAVISSYVNYLGLDLTLALVLIACFGLVLSDSARRMRRTPEEGSFGEHRVGTPEIILIGGFLCFPALLVVLTKLLHSGYTPRYGWPAILGLALGPVYLARTVWLKPCSAYLLVALLIAFAYQSGRDFRRLYKVGPSPVDGRWSRLAELSGSQPSLPVVIGSPIEYLEAAEYSPPELRDRLVGVVDEDIATRLVGADTPDKTNRLLAQFIPLHVEDLAAFQAAHQRFILRSDAAYGDYDWFTQYLVERRYHLSLLSKDASVSLYIAER